MDRKAPDAGSADSATIARRLVAARRQAQALPDYPGELPRDLEAGYACQDVGIALWGRPVVGWKDGKIPTEWETKLGEERLVGPIFEGAVQAPGANDSGTLESATFAVIPGGFAAVCRLTYVFPMADPPSDLRARRECQACRWRSGPALRVESQPWTYVSGAL